MHASDSGLNPTRRALLSLCRLDRVWARGEGAWLVDPDGRRFLDGHAQYGAAILGRAHPALVRALREALDAGEPAMVQPQSAPAIERLASELVGLAPPGLGRCVFTTSGAEAVEAAIRLVRAATGRPVVLSAEGSYHGKTLGALAATGQPHHAEGFGPTPPGFARVAYGDAGALEAILAAGAGRIAALLLEPIQGEAGVRIPPPGYLARARELTRRHGVLLVLDEIQTGLARTGPLFACEAEGVSPDVLVLAKGLGGGLFPLGACLANDSAWTGRFGLGHGSTFAENALAARVGSAVLTELTAGGVASSVPARGRVLARALASLAARHPRRIAAVRSSGLLGAIELAPLAGTEGSFLSILDRHGMLAYALAGWIAEVSGVLVLPALGPTPVLRVAPPLVATADEVAAIVGGVDAALEALGDDPTRPLADFLSARPPRTRIEWIPPARRIGAAPDVRRYAFVLHPIGPRDAAVTNPGLRAAPADALDRVAELVAALPPVAMFEGPIVRSSEGAAACGTIVLVPWTPDRMRERGAREAEAAVVAAVDLAAGLGAEVVGLGGHTTPASRRGLAAIGRGPRITTGNALTAGMAVEAIRAAAAAIGLEFGRSAAAVVGARGSVGGLVARLLARAGIGELVLVGHGAGGAARLDGLARAIALDGCLTRTAADLGALERCRIVVSATTSTAAVLGHAPLAAGTILCDLAIPPDAPPRLRSRPDLVVVDGGLVEFPEPAAAFGPGNLFGLPPGIQLACLAETTLLALAGIDRDVGVGDEPSLADVDLVLGLAARHGFRSAAGPGPSPMPARSLRVATDGVSR